MALQYPKNRNERKIHKESAIASYEQELEELSKKYPRLVALYYSEHMGNWQVVLVDDDFEAETKEEALQELEVDFTEHYVATPEDKALFS